MRVLYATDGSGPAREGERLIASLFDPATSIHVFAVTPESLDELYDLDHLDLPPLNSEQVAKEGAEHLAEYGFSVSSSSTRGNPAFEILRLLDTGGYDLVVLGAGHTTWIGNHLLGSVGTHVLHDAPCPVLVTHRAPTGSGRILVGIDGSHEAMQTALLAATLVDRTKCSFTVAYSVTQPWVSIAAYPPGLPLGNHAAYKTMQERKMEHARHLVEMASKELKERGFEAEGVVLSGAPGPHLLKEAENLSADLVVVGSRGLGPVKRTLLGSVSDQVARHAPATLVGRLTKKPSSRDPEMQLT